MSSVVMYTDGSCQGNPGPGGWAALLRWSGGTASTAQEKVLTGSEKETTNNRMEILAVIQGLENLNRPSKVTVYTDSQYLKQGITVWIHGWQKNGWKTAQKKPVKNKDLWCRLLEVASKHQIEWKWVKAHAGHPENEKVDTLARQASMGPF